MSRLPVYRKRRIWAIWMPICAIATVAYFYSFTETLTLNGLGLLSMIVAFAGMTAVVKEGSTL